MTELELLRLDVQRLRKALDSAFGVIQLVADRALGDIDVSYELAGWTRHELRLARAALAHPAPVVSASKDEYPVKPPTDAESQTRASAPTCATPGCGQHERIDHEGACIWCPCPGWQPVPDAP